MLNAKKKQNKGDTEKEQTDENDEIYEMLHQPWEIDRVHWITVKRDCSSLQRQLKNGSRHKTILLRGNSSVLGVDTTFNLCNMWVTDTCYHNKRIIKPKTGNNPLFLGPTLFYFTKDDKTFSRLGL